MNSTGNNLFTSHFQHRALRVFLASIVILIALTAHAQNTVTPTTSTTQFAASVDPLSPLTAPTGAIILNGSAISPVTNRPVRHLWVADSFLGMCRIDPDLDSPGPYTINSSICPLSAVPGLQGGAMAFDSIHNLIYFVDNQVKAPLGVFRVNYLPDGDSGNGTFDVQTLFNMAGALPNHVFTGGQTGCASCSNRGEIKRRA